MTATDEIRVMVVDDSLAFRTLVRQALDPEPDIRIVGSARNGQAALETIDELRPDIITLDVEMPVMSGVEMLKQLESSPNKPTVIMLSSGATGACSTVEALALGATDFVVKPRGDSFDDNLEKLRNLLVRRIRALASAAPAPAPAPSAPVAPAADRPRSGRSVAAVVIGVSTGGPQALAELLPALPADFPLPVLVVQHMPEGFTASLAGSLDRSSRLEVLEATDGHPVRAGEVLIAPGGMHMSVGGTADQPRVKLDRGPLVQSCRPSVDRLFLSAADVWGGNCLAILLTGMGEDGVHGARLLREKGAELWAQDEASSVVWGMPGRAVEEGLADRVCSLTELTGTLPGLAHRAVR